MTDVEKVRGANGGAVIPFLRAELTGGKKNRLFAYSGYLDVINRGTELGPPGIRTATTEGASVSRLSDIASPQSG